MAGENNRDRFEESAERRRLFLEAMEEEHSLKIAYARAGITDTTYRRWRSVYPDFAKKVDALKAFGVRDDGTIDPGFAAFRLRYFRMKSYWFHLMAIDAYEKTRPGNITLILWPPEHGKTSLFEDYASYKLAVDPNYRFTIGSEKQDMSRKVLRRVKNRMSEGGPYREYVAKWGPFAPQVGEGSRTQPWGADYFDVFKKQGHDERDYSMVALGMTSAIAGTRTDHLHVDDPQSLKSFQKNPEKHSEEMLEVFRQDWLTRPGENGRTTINGTRVGEGDFYELLMEEFDEDILKVIKFPAIRYDELAGENRPLWEYDAEESERQGRHVGWTMEMLERQRKKVGEEAWARNYMQQPRAGTDRTFGDDVINKALNPLRSVDHGAPDGGSCIITIDPGFGHNATSLLHISPDTLSVVDMVDDIKFTSNEQIFGRLEDFLHRSLAMGSHVTDVVIETMAFQKGLATDRQLRELQDRFGFAIREHLTGVNKYDENIGIPSMARDFRLGRIDIPYAEDDYTRQMADALIGQLKAWKPKKRGTELRQDLVMALWFGWIVWRDRKSWVEQTATSFSFSGMPYKPTGSGSGLLIPRSAA